MNLYYWSSQQQRWCPMEVTYPNAHIRMLARAWLRSIGFCTAVTKRACAQRVAL